MHLKSNVTYGDGCRSYELDGQYFVAFRDGQRVQHCMKIDADLYRAFNEFELQDLSWLNVWDRHIEQSEVWEISLNERAMMKQDTVEEIVFRSMEIEQVHRAIMELPDIQKRRVLLHFLGWLSPWN